MGTADHGGYDIIAEYPIAVLSAGLARNPYKPANPGFQPLRLGVLVCNAITTPTVTAVAGVTPANPLQPELTATVTDATAMVEVTGFDTGGGAVQPLATTQTIPVPYTMTIRTSVDVGGFGVALDFIPHAGYPIVSASTIDTSAAGSAPIIGAMLLYVWFVAGSAAVQQVADSLEPAIEQAILTAVLASLGSGPTLFPLGLSRVPGTGTMFTAGAPGPTRLDVAVTSTTIRLLVPLMSGTPGNAATISRSSLAPGDLGVIIVSNMCLLRDFVRSRIASAFGLPLSGFSATNACFMAGPASSTLAGLPAGFMMSNLQAGIDETGMLQVFFEWSAPVGPGVTQVGTFTQTLFPSVSITGGVIPLTRIGFAASAPLAPAMPPVVTFSTKREWWVYLLYGIFFTPASPALQAIQDAINDAIAGGRTPVTAPLVKAFAGSGGALRDPTRDVTSLPPGVTEPPISGGTASIFQGDAIFRAIATTSARYRDHDLVVHLT